MPPILRQSQFFGKVFSSISSSSLFKCFAISLKECVCWPSLSRSDESFSMLLLLLLFSKDLFKVVKIVSSVWVSFSCVLSESKTDGRSLDCFFVWISSFCVKKAILFLLMFMLMFCFDGMLSLLFFRRFFFEESFESFLI